MRKTTFLKTLLLIVVLLAGTSLSEAATITLTGADMSATDGTQNITKNGIGFNGFMKQYSSTKIWFTSGTGYIYNTTSLGSITKITLSYNSGGSSSAVQRFNVGTAALSSYMSSGGTTVSTSTGGTTYDFTGGVGSGFFNLSVSSKNLQLVSLTIEYTPAVSCTASNLAFAQPVVNKLVADAAFTQAASSLNATTAITYESSNTGVANVNAATGEVSIIGAGTTTITASQAAGSHSSVEYCAATAAYTVNVTSAAPTITVTEVTVPDMVAYAGETDTETINISGINLTENIRLEISGDNADQFALSTNTVAQVGGTAANTVVTVIYQPTTAGAHTAVLSVLSAGATTVTRTLNGSATWKALTKPMLTGATSVSANALTLNWDAVSGATEYEVNVFTKTGSAGISSETEAFNNVVANGNLIGSATYLTGWSASSQGINRQIYTSTGNFGVAIPSFAFTTTGDFIETKTYSSPVTSISFWAKQQTGATSSTLIEGYNGTSWTTIATLSNADAATAGTKTYDLVALGFTDVIKVKLTYTKVAGNLSIDDITVVSGAGSISTPIAGSPFTVSTNSKDLTGLVTSTTYYYTVKAKNANVSSELSDEMSVATLGTSVPELNAGLNLRVVDGNIVFDAVANQMVEVYNAVGQRIKSATTIDGLNTITIGNKGVVLVKVGTQIQKVML